MDGETELPACNDCGSHMWVGDESGLCDFCERAAPIKKQREELAKRYGFCLECNQEFKFDPHEPYAYCKCGTTEWGQNRPLHVDNSQRLQVQCEELTKALKDVVGACEDAGDMAKVRMGPTYHRIKEVLKKSGVE